MLVMSNQVIQYIDGANTKIHDKPNSLPTLIGELHKSNAKLNANPLIIKNGWSANSVLQ
jgi:hypothetical protein